MYVGMEAYVRIFLFSVLEVSGSAGLPRDSLNVAEKIESLTFTENVNSNPRLRSPKPIHYTDHRPYRLSSLCFTLGVLGVNIPVPLTKKYSWFWSSLHLPILLFLQGDKFSLSCYTQRGSVCRLVTWWVWFLLQLSCLSTSVQWDCIFFPFSSPLE